MVSINVIKKMYGKQFPSMWWKEKVSHCNKKLSQNNDLVGPNCQSNDKLSRNNDWSYDL